MQMETHLRFAIRHMIMQLSVAHTIQPVVLLTLIETIRLELSGDVR
jgi:hypothetical protein